MLFKLLLGSLHVNNTSHLAIRDSGVKEIRTFHDGSAPLAMTDTYLS